MTAGFGLSIGTVNSVWAATAGDRERPVVRVRRTAVTFDSAGGARVGGLPRFAPVVTDFADLTREVEPVVLGGRNWTSADLVAAVASCLVTAAKPESEPVITYPACYSERKIAALRHALDWTATPEALLMPEPVAAVEWLDAEYGVSENGLTLVYDLGGTSLDVAVVRTEADRDERGVLGRAVRSHDHGGRPLGAILARYARALSPGVPAPVSKVVPATDTTRLRTWNARNSLRLVRRCVHATGLSLRDIDRVLLVGGAARPVEVARVLDELGLPVVMSPDPAHTVALGAALASARLADAGSNLGRYARGAAVLSSAAVVSAMAMSAATMLGGGPVGSDGPVLEFAPALAGPADNAITGDLSRGADGEPAALSGGADVVMPASYSWRPASYATIAQQLSPAPAAVGLARMSSVDPSGSHCGPNDHMTLPTYADPARFTNPLPFWVPPSSQPFTGPAFRIPEISLPRVMSTTGVTAAQQVSSSGAAVSSPATSSSGAPNSTAPQPNPLLPPPPANVPAPGAPVYDAGVPPTGAVNSPISTPSNGLGSASNTPGTTTSGTGSSTNGTAASNSSTAAGTSSGPSTSSGLGGTTSTGTGGTNSSGGAHSGGTSSGTSGASLGGGTNSGGGTTASGGNSTAAGGNSTAASGGNSTASGGSSAAGSGSNGSSQGGSSGGGGSNH